MPSFFSNVLKAPSDPILGLTVSFLKDPRKEKVNLSVGVYRTENGETPVLSSVKKAEKILLEEESSKTYLPIDGDPLYLEEVGKLVLGQDLYKSRRLGLTCIQSLGGAGGLRLGGEFLAQECKNLSCYISDPTWPNHQGIFSQCGLNVLTYPYYDFENKTVRFDLMMEFFSSVPPQSIIVLHASCHNPSGADLNQNQWDLLADLCKHRKLIPFFDAAYLGFDVSFEEDAYPIRLFVKKGIECLASVSFSKNFSLYAERIGFFFLFSEENNSEACLSQFKKLVRRNYSNPPLHGAKIIAKILQTPSLKKEWEEELCQMRDRIGFLRNLFVTRLSLSSMQKDYSYLVDKKGLFSFCDLTKKQVDRLIEEHGIYMTQDGRINIAGLSEVNLDRVVSALCSVGG